MPVLRSIQVSSDQVSKKLVDFNIALFLMDFDTDVDDFLGPRGPLVLPLVDPPVRTTQ